MKSYFKLERYEEKINFNSIKLNIQSEYQFDYILAEASVFEVIR